MSTENIELTTAWQLIDAGPIAFQIISGSHAEFHIGSAEPVPNAAAHKLNSITVPGYDYGGSENVYARKTYEGSVILSYTPIL